MDRDTMGTLARLEWPRSDVALVTMHRPEVLNAMSFELVDELHEIFDRLHRDNDCRVVILTGAGRAFSSGLDLSGPAVASTAEGTSGPRAGMLTQERIADLAIKIHRLQHPVIAAVNGLAYGGGLGLALACDLRVASADAAFCTQFIKVGLSGCDIGISYTLPRAVGSTVAFEMMLTARRVEADEALRVGLVSEVVEDAVDRALELSELITRHSPFGVVMTKQVMWANLDAGGMEQAVHLENRTQILASTGGEIAEAAAAFMEKRDPAWVTDRRADGDRADG